MLFLVAALMLLGVVLGTVAHAPLSVTAALAAVIAVWLGIFAVREHHGRQHHTSAH
ncbi:hypothetical protein LK07_24910 [Streptomyces pluripotens]|uniref:Small hydrophobic membrane protein n=1 Tax=Streptomyces pluripotens TaxID=1355015 RepID=A0A221P3K3_9ACTN|nr:MULTISPECIES: hypothetical protein [Streptomyces]ASN26714.1 hypothetical protein LK07_24910 [Streptomyces pluripotens]KIE26115.1 membrane protein [Streptomyces sp. MUSC 125]MCH0559565.1 hypothetical protein [Streptomyces sp. MUM 16J]